MIKKFIITFICLLLCSCTYSSDMETELNNILDNTSTIDVRQNNFTPYVDYYLPSDLHEIDAEELSYSFENEFCKIALNINVSNIINQKYYKENVLKDEGFFDNSKLIFTKQGTYFNPDYEETAFVFKLYDYDEKYFVHFNSIDVNIYAISDSDSILFTAKKMIEIARGADIDKDAVVTNYSTKDVIDYQKKQIDLFNNTFPIDGRIEDLLVEEETLTPEQ